MCQSSPTLYGNVDIAMGKFFLYVNELNLETTAFAKKKLFN